MLCNNELKLSNHYKFLCFYVPANFDFFLFNEVAVYSPRHWCLCWYRWLSGSSSPNSSSTITRLYIFPYCYVFIVLNTFTFPRKFSGLHISFLRISKNFRSRVLKSWAHWKFWNQEAVISRIQQCWIMYIYANFSYFILLFKKL